MNNYQSQSEIENIVRGFETCVTDKDGFNHRDHLLVAIWYVETVGREAALGRMRSSLMRFLNHHGVDIQKYSETITVFWLDRIAEKLNEFEPGVSLVEKCNSIVASPEFQKDKAPVNSRVHTPATRVEAAESPVKS